MKAFSCLEQTYNERQDYSERQALQKQGISKGIDFALKNPKASERYHPQKQINVEPSEF
jgi:hypothetical protein